MKSASTGETLTVSQYAKRLQPLKTYRVWFWNEQSYAESKTVLACHKNDALAMASNPYLVEEVNQ